MGAPSTKTFVMVFALPTLLGCAIGGMDHEAVVQAVTQSMCTLLLLLMLAFGPPFDPDDPDGFS